MTVSALIGYVVWALVAATAAVALFALLKFLLRGREERPKEPGKLAQYRTERAVDRSLKELERKVKEKS